MDDKSKLFSGRVGVAALLGQLVFQVMFMAQIFKTLEIHEMQEKQSLRVYLIALIIHTLGFV